MQEWNEEICEKKILEMFANVKTRNDLNSLLSSDEPESYPEAISAADFGNILCSELNSIWEPQQLSEHEVCQVVIPSERTVP